MKCKVFLLVKGKRKEFSFLGLLFQSNVTLVSRGVQEQNTFNQESCSDNQTHRTCRGNFPSHEPHFKFPKNSSRYRLLQSLP